MCRCDRVRLAAGLRGCDTLLVHGSQPADRLELCIAALQQHTYPGQYLAYWRERESRPTRLQLTIVYRPTAHDPDGPFRNHLGRVQCTILELTRVQTPPSPTSCRWTFFFYTIQVQNCSRLSADVWLCRFGIFISFHSCDTMEGLGQVLSGAKEMAIHFPPSDDELHVRFIDRLFCMYVYIRQAYVFCPASTYRGWSFVFAFVLGNGNNHEESTRGFCLPVNLYLCAVFVCPFAFRTDSLAHLPNTHLRCFLFFSSNDKRLGKLHRHTGQGLRNSR